MRNPMSFQQRSEDPINRLSAAIEFEECRFKKITLAYQLISELNPTLTAELKLEMALWALGEK